VLSVSCATTAGLSAGSNPEETNTRPTPLHPVELALRAAQQPPASDLRPVHNIEYCASESLGDCSTLMSKINAIESLNQCAHYRGAVRATGHFPTEQLRSTATSSPTRWTDQTQPGTLARLHRCDHLRELSPHRVQAGPPPRTDGQIINHQAG
jgi:hypothetical protein